MRSTLAAFAIFLFLSNCRKQTMIENNYSNFFDKGDLSKSEFVDSISNRYFSEIFYALEEPDLRSTSHQFSLRLLVASSFYNPYCIRIERNDTASIVVFKIKADEADFIRAGLDGLNLTYTSGHPIMDSLSIDLFRTVERYDFYPGFDEIRSSAADGIVYLLEYSLDNEYKVVEGWSGGNYRGKDDLLRIVDAIHTFVPEGMLPNLRQAKKLDDVLFSPLQKDSLVKFKK